MNYPIINIAEVFKGVTFYLDGGSFSNWFVAPSNNPWISSSPTSVGGRTIINAQKEFVSLVYTIAAFAESKGGVPVTPLSIDDYTNQYSFNFSFSSAHLLQLQIINSLPYPSLQFSANLMNAAPDFRTVSDAITEGLKSDTLLAGKLTMVFKGIELVNKVALRYNLRKIVAQLTQQLSVSPITATQLMAETTTFVRSNLSTIAATTFGSLQPSEQHQLVDYLIQLVLESSVAKKTKEGCFDNKAIFEKIILRDVLELPDIEVNTDLQHTRPVSHQLTF